MFSTFHFLHVFGSSLRHKQLLTMVHICHIRNVQCSLVSFEFLSRSSKSSDPWEHASASVLLGSIWLNILNILNILYSKSQHLSFCHV